MQLAHELAQALHDGEAASSDAAVFQRRAQEAEAEVTRLNKTLGELRLAIAGSTEQQAPPAPVTGDELPAINESLRRRVARHAPATRRVARLVRYNVL